MFADRSDPGAAEAAIRAGVAAYVVNGLAPERVRPILEAAVTRFELMQAMRADLAGISREHMACVLAGNR